VLSLPPPLLVVPALVLSPSLPTFSVLSAAVLVSFLPSRKLYIYQSVFSLANMLSIIYGYFEIAAREGDIGAGLKGLVPGN
jgi:hypothetical protein